MDLFAKEENIPFSIKFKECVYGKENIIDIKKFSKQDIEPDNLPILKELHELSVTFLKKSDSEGIPEDAGLFMDLLDVIDCAYYDKDMDMSYVKCESETFLYLQNEGNRSYPIVPGKYRIIVRWSKIFYYSYIKIDPLHISDKELDIMKMDLEESCKGLSKDIFTSSNEINYLNDSEFCEMFQLDEFNYIKRNYNKIRYALNNIVEKPLFQLNKIYDVKSYHLSKKIDEKSCRWLQGYRGQAKNEGGFNKPRYILTSAIENNYEISANICIKKFILIFIKKLHEGRRNLEKYDMFYKNIKYVREKYISIYQFVSDDMFLNTIGIGIKRIDKLYKEIREIEDYFNEILNKPLFSKLNTYRNIQIPSIMTKDERYNLIYRIYKSLIKNTEHNDNNMPKFKSKYTDIIYEYWCYVKTIQSLIMLGYNPQSGWIYNKEFNNESIIPFIDDGEKVTLSKGDITLDVIFNDIYATHKNEAKDKKKLVWAMTSHNKPDIHIDVYKRNLFKYCIIADSKYRNPNSFWKVRQAYRHQYKTTKAMEQLFDYASKYYFIKEDEDDLRINAVKKVIALCPIPKNTDDEILEYESNVAIVCLNPINGVKEYVSYLEMLIR
ncbi:hypothetical protein EXM65_08325 [Clostridium botulinum]|uniref:DUF2357 domain-containing protein n=1 Tax=Clostridium botulinum TaxID=1491 RepID=A0A6M0SMS5_CLOBO|nr:hypothetical protein [Clostridium botulinum]